MKTFTTLMAACALLVSCGLHRPYVADKYATQQALEVTSVSVADVATAEQQMQTSAKRKNSSSWWGDIEYAGLPWVTNLSRPNEISHGLFNRHFTIWPSHGRYYDQDKARWKWQRPVFFATTEDLFTQTIVVPYLVPMLERAGANVFLPRERDWQRNEVIVDNDDSSSAAQYRETGTNAPWQDAGVRGFSWKQKTYKDNQNPFAAGTTRMAVASKDGGSEITYQPDIPESGKYAVYVSYPKVDDNVDDARYTVWHRGQSTVFRVNQRMGSGTWVYLGTFDFEAGNSVRNRVVLSNRSDRKGHVTADAVRFGGGMGNIERGGTTSGFPRCYEGARYYAQWAGAPYEVYSYKQGQNDYRDDIYARPYMSSWLSGGSCFLPGKEGKNVPIELSLAVHSDAGYVPGLATVYGPFFICTTDHEGGVFPTGVSRQASKAFISDLRDGVKQDLSAIYGNWPVRELYDKNYAETRLPEVPSAILETLSHQSFPDMVKALDPNFRFDLARSVYKSILRFVSDAHGDSYVVAPLPPVAVSAEFTSSSDVHVRWEPQHDDLEKTAVPTSYVVYTKAGDNDFDNGTLVKGTSLKMRLQPDVVYSFKVTAVNRGGESFPSETVTALCHQGAKRSVLIVNGFHRLASPAVRQTDTEVGFDFATDPGVSYGSFAGWSGPQQVFDRSKVGPEGPGSLGYGSDEWQGMFIAGNEFNYPSAHAEAMKSMTLYNVSSCSSAAVESGKVDMMKYHVVDVLLGLERNDGYSLKPYKTFSTPMRQLLTSYAQSGGALLVSGAYVASDMTSAPEALFLKNVLKLSYGGTLKGGISPTLQGLGTTFDIYRSLNEQHYAATSTDVLVPCPEAFTAMTYADGNPACVAYAGTDYHALCLGFPFECITSAQKQASLMQAFLTFLMSK